MNLLSIDAWTTPEAPLKAEFQLRVPNYANRAGQRLVLPLAVFHINGQNPFASVRRTYPIYFDYPTEAYDEVTFELPAGIELGSLPSNQKIDAGAAFYELSAVTENNSLHMKRLVKIEAYHVPVNNYPALRKFYENVRVNDDQQAILKPAQSASKN